MRHASPLARRWVHGTLAAALLISAAVAAPAPARADDDGYYHGPTAPGRYGDDDRNDEWDDDHYDDDHGDDDDHDDRYGRDSDRVPDAHERARQLLQQGRIRPLAEILSQVGTALEGRLIDTEFEREDGLYVYEFTVVRPNGRVQEIYVDAATARVVKIEDDD
ncbi:PepSY domain-containing protein [Roseospira goensis]|uniref:Putative membrane protein YkoI n=1 Tax=Roseospira goensis TaxID=391922 RepID=A0A7W6RZL7_9PROT|nr:PepSY domain-containing protein [Roseospira goensis]MBB4285477.1 putative membrane protein YkoI [Roseospira goensis]